jgi:hypothetical protein
LPESAEGRDAALRTDRAGDGGIHAVARLPSRHASRWRYFQSARAPRRRWVAHGGPIGAGAPGPRGHPRSGT